jgi:hypothetical protein
MSAAKYPDSGPVSMVMALPSQPPLSAWTRRRAMLLAAAHATGPDDLARLLRMLGLDRTEAAR